MHAASYCLHLLAEKGLKNSPTCLMQTINMTFVALHFYNSLAFSDIYLQNKHTKAVILTLSTPNADNTCTYAVVKMPLSFTDL